VTSQFPSAFGSLFTLTELSPLVCWVNIKWNTQMLGQEGTLRLALAVVTLWRVLSISLFTVPHSLPHSPLLWKDKTTEELEMGSSKPRVCSYHL
jgi:hypothetical protein